MRTLILGDRILTRILDDGEISEILCDASQPILDYAACRGLAASMYKNQRKYRFLVLALLSAEQCFVFDGWRCGQDLLDAAKIPIYDHRG